MRTLTAILIILGVFMLMGCDEPKTSTAMEELQKTEDNQTRLLKSDPPPQFNTSQERKNLIRRLKTFNVEDKISFIYLLTDYGQIVRFDTVKGKVSSVNSMLTCTDQVVVKRASNARYGVVTIPSPDFDGSYGSNGDAIFWFNTDDAYCEWNGKYFLTDQPLKLKSAPLLVEATSGD